MAGWLDRLGATLLDASLAATAITGLVVLAMLQCRQPARRRVWARAGILSTLALIPLSALNPVPRIDLRGPIRLLFSTAFEDDSAWIPQPGEARTELLAEAAEADCPDPGSTSPSGFRWVGRGLVVAYLSGVSIGLGWISMGLWGGVLLIRRSQTPSVETWNFYESLPVPKGATRPRFVVSERVRRPVLFGAIRPVILIPANLDRSGSSSQIRLGLLHELAHLENHDHWFGPLATLAQSIWFFLPTFWWIRDQMRLDQEFLADRRAVSHFGSSGHYASSLVELASDGVNIPTGRDVSSSPQSSGNSSPTGVASSLIQRVQMLLRCPFPLEGSTPLWWRWSTVLTLLLATLATSCLTIRGLGGWWALPRLSVPGEVRVFKIPQLVIGPRSGQDRSFDLHYRLPDTFTLTLEVLADPGELAELEILGHGLGPRSKLRENPPAPRLWHGVQIRRRRGFDRVEVDGQTPGSMLPVSTSGSWLTIHPLNEQTTRIRDLMIAW